jgi:KUP system potassium uptake protein
MGHFGRLPIRVGWFAVILPALLLNYFGQEHCCFPTPRAIENPFYPKSGSWLDLFAL